MEIKKIINRIYNLDYTKVLIDNRKEFIIEHGVCDFTNSFRKIDTTIGITVIPQGYEHGLFYRNDLVGNEIYSSLRYYPDIVRFAFNVSGLKSGSFYKITVLAKSMGENQDITANRELVVTTSGKELIIKKDLTGIDEHKQYHGIYRATSNTVMFFFSLGKLSIKDIIIDEVELIEEKETVEDKIVFNTGKNQLVSYGIFEVTNKADSNYLGKYILNPKLNGVGLNLYYDKVDKEFIIERDNSYDKTDMSLAHKSLYFNINIDNLVYKGIMNTTEISDEISPNTLKKGYIKFKLFDFNGNNVSDKDISGRIIVNIYKL